MLPASACCSRPIGRECRVVEPSSIRGPLRRAPRPLGGRQTHSRRPIVQEAVSNDCSTIAFEELTDIRDRISGAKTFHAWAFRRLYDYMAYKAEEYGVETMQVDPTYTSQRCSTCGTTLREKRPSQAKFCYQKCGYSPAAQ